MKLIALLITFCLSMNVFASTGTIQELEKHLDDYHYAMSVEWDQKDAKFHEEKTKEFTNQMEKLITESGLTQTQIVNLVEKKMNNKAAADHLRLKMSLMGDASPEQFAAMMKEFSSEFYDRGASWHGAIVITASVLAVLTVALTFAVWFSATHGCQRWEQTCDWYGCRNSNVCADYGYIGPHL